MVLGHIVPTLTPKPCRHHVEKCRCYPENNHSEPSRNQPCIAKRILKTHCPKPNYQWNITDDEAELSVAASMFSATSLTVSCCTQLYTPLSSSPERRHRARPHRCKGVPHPVDHFTSPRTTGMSPSSSADLPLPSASTIVDHTRPL
jgi:hypothetical protein